MVLQLLFLIFILSLLFLLLRLFVLLNFLSLFHYCLHLFLHHLMLNLSHCNSNLHCTCLIWFQTLQKILQFCCYFRLFLLKLIYHMGQHLHLNHFLLLWIRLGHLRHHILSIASHVLLHLHTNSLLNLEIVQSLSFSLLDNFFFEFFL